MKWKAKTRQVSWLGLALAVALLSGCGLRQRMFDNGRVKPLEPNAFFADGRSARPLVPETVARGHLNEDDHLYRGLSNGNIATTFPFPIGAAELENGRERFEIYCSVCHGYAGLGDGIVVQRGYKKPSSFHEERLRAAPVGYFFSVMTNGFGTMPSYATMVSPEERWHITAYIRALQLSQNATVNDVPEGSREQLRRETP